MSVLRWAARLTAATTIAVSLAGLVGAAPVYANDPGEGCVGLPEVPEAWVCITELDPADAAPAPQGPVIFQFTVPNACAFGECTGEQLVQVRLVQLSSGAVLVIDYDGMRITIYGNGADLSQLLARVLAVLNAIAQNIIDPIACNLLIEIFGGDPPGYNCPPY